MMYMSDRTASEPLAPVSRAGLAALTLAIVAIFYLGVLPTPVLDLAARSISTIF
jgi:NADH:ubiquinone oxidoreductase subunit 2 (subunit N)